MSSLAEAPQDSVLRRHWEAARNNGTNTSGSSSSGSNNPTSGGFFTWLKSLFS